MCGMTSKTYVDLACCFCGCNAGPRRQYFENAKGLAKHIQAVHAVLLPLVGLPADALLNDVVEEVVRKRCATPVTELEIMGLMAFKPEKDHMRTWKGNNPIIFAHEGEGAIPDPDILETETAKDSDADREEPGQSAEDKSEDSDF